MILSWPSRDLSPNSRSGWRAKAAATKAAKEEAVLITRTGKERWPDVDFAEELELTIVFCPPDRRRRDLDNCFAMCKPYIDGIFEVWELDDSRIKKVHLSWGPVLRPDGRVIIYVKDLE